MIGKIKILIADDEPNIRLFLRANLKARGYEVYLAKDGREVLETAELVMPDLVILDMNMPHFSGLEVCRRIRVWGSMPIIILSIRGEEKDKVQALNEGADDYMTKPFGIEELLARIKVALRHAGGQDAVVPVFRAGNLVVDLSRRVVQKEGKAIKLTPTEFRLLAYLTVNCGKLFTHSDLLHNVWGPEYSEEREYLRVFIGQLRHKIEDDPANPKFIITEPCVGYRFVNPG